MARATKRFLRQEFIAVIVVVGYAFLVLAILNFLLWDNWLLSLLFLVIGVYLAFTFEGVQINYYENRFKTFSSKFGMTKHYWYSFDEYPYISVLSMNQKSTVYGMSGTGIASKYQVYRVYLLNKTHLDKILLAEYSNEADAMTMASSVAGQAGIKVVTYSPQISEASQARRKRV